MWFKKQEAAPAPERKYKAEDYFADWPSPKELPQDAARIDVLTREVQALREKVLDYKVRIAELEASRLADAKAINDWFRNSANATFCELRNAAVKDLRREVIITDVVKEHIRQAVEAVAKDVFSTNEANTFGIELGKAIVRAVGKKLGQRW